MRMPSQDQPQQGDSYDLLIDAHCRRAIVGQYRQPTGRRGIQECSQTGHVTLAPEATRLHLDGNDIACGPVRFVDELWDDSQVLANGYIADYDHTLLGPLRGPIPIVQMGVTPTVIQRASPALGEHTDEVLREVGFSETEIEHFRCGGVVG